MTMTNQDRETEEEEEGSNNRAWRVGTGSACCRGVHTHWCREGLSAR